MCGACAISSIWKGSAEQRASLSGQAAPFFFPETGLLTYPNKEWDVKRETTTPLLSCLSRLRATRSEKFALRPACCSSRKKRGMLFSGLTIALIRAPDQLKAVCRTCARFLGHNAVDEPHRIGPNHARAP